MVAKNTEIGKIALQYGEYYIRVGDRYNWVLARTRISEETSKESEAVHGYYGTLASAWNSLCELQAKKKNGPKGEWVADMKMFLDLKETMRGIEEAIISKYRLSGVEAVKDTSKK